MFLYTFYSTTFLGKIKKLYLEKKCLRQLNNCVYLQRQQQMTRFFS